MGSERRGHEYCIRPDDELCDVRMLHERVDLQLRHRQCSHATRALPFPSRTACHTLRSQNLYGTKHAGLNFDCPLTTAMTGWKPSAQTFADFIDLEYDSTTYLIGLGTYDGSVFIVKLDSSGNSAGFAYSRVIADWSLAPADSIRTMEGFGAGCASRTSLITR